MDTRASPEDAGKREGPRRIEAPATTPSQPEAQSQMAYSHDNGDDSGVQSPTDVEPGNFPSNPCGREAPHSPDRTPKVSGNVYYDSGWIPGVAFRREKLVVVVREHDDGRLEQWTHNMLFGRWAQSQQLDDDKGPGTGGVFVPRAPPGPAGITSATIPPIGEKSPVPH